MLTESEIILVTIIIGLFLLIFTTRLKTELIALLVLLALYFTGLVTAPQALAGFSSSVVITLLGLFVITHALEETGVVQWIATRLNTIGGGSETRLIGLFMVAGAMLSLIMNNVAAGAVLLPAAVHVVRAPQVNGSTVSVSKLLMPMSFGTLVGGMATYLTTANILMSELLQSRGLDGLNMLDFIPTGGLIVVAGVAYMLLIGRHLLPNRGSLSGAMLEPDLPSTYVLDERFWELRVRQNATIADKSLGATGIGSELGLTVAAIQRPRQTIAMPNTEQMIRPRDRLVVIGRKDRIDRLLAWGTELLDDPDTGNNYTDLLGEPVEIVIAPRSNALGKTLTQLNFRQRYKVTAVALWRGNRSYRTDVGKMPLQVGDALLVTGEANDMKRLADDRNYIVPASGYAALSYRPQKAPFALLITAIVLTLAIFNLVTLPIVMLAGAAALVVTGCLEMDEFYEAIEWRVIFLVAGMLPLSVAIDETGLADRVGNLVTDLLSDAHPLVLVGGMVLLTMLVVQIIGGQITALLVGPIAINAALQAGVNPQAMAAAVAMACSMAFLTPIAHPVNILMMVPGGYTFGDFFKVGVGMTLVTLAAMLLGLSLFWGVG